jgi:hypothetical protein
MTIGSTYLRLSQFNYHKKFMSSFIVYLESTRCQPENLLRLGQAYSCTNKMAYYGIVVIEDIARIEPGLVLGTYESGQLTIRQNVATLDLVHADGTVIETGGYLLHLKTKFTKGKPAFVTVTKPNEIIV